MASSDGTSSFVAAVGVATLVGLGAMGVAAQIGLGSGTGVISPDAGPVVIVDGGPQVTVPATGLATISYDGGTVGPSPVQGFTATGILFNGSVTELGLDGGAPQVLVTICGAYLDAGLNLQTMPGVLLYGIDDVTVSCPANSPQIALTAEGAAVPDGGYPSWQCACWNPDAGWCAVAAGSAIDGTLYDAGPQAQATILAGLWNGPGCRPKTCAELSGFPSYPPECF
jgi:hypothetical protein